MKYQYFLWLTVGLFATPISAQTIKEILPNGLKVIVREDHRAPIVMSQLWYKVGSVDEPIGKSGLSHALEHMMFKGTHTIPDGEFSRQIAALGGELNAYTSPTETVYHEYFAKQHLPKILEMEADRMVNLNFSNQSFQNEMKVIREERRQTIDDNPHGQMYEALISQAWQKPTNRISVIGKMHDLHQLQAQDLRRWYQKWYAPNNAVLVIVGDVDARKTIDLVKEKFNHIPAKLLPKRLNLTETEVRSRPKSAYSHGNTQQPIFFLSYRVPYLNQSNQLDNKTLYALYMLTNILDGHSASRFDRNLVRGTQYAFQISASYSMLSRAPQLWTIPAMPNQGVSVEQLRNAVEQEIQNIAQNGVSEQELALAKVREKSNTIYERDGLDNQAYLIGSLEINGLDFRDEEKIRQKINEVSVDDIQNAAKLLVPNRQIFIQLNPRPKVTLYQTK